MLQMLSAIFYELSGLKNKTLSNEITTLLYYNINYY